jgi:hypothetical protein
VNKPPEEPDRRAAKTQAPAGVNWSDPNVPAGDSPPLPRWPLYVGIAAWGLWIVFLAVMVVLRFRIATV